MSPDDSGWRQFGKWAVSGCDAAGGGWQAASTGYRVTTSAFRG